MIFGIVSTCCEASVQKSGELAFILSCNPLHNVSSAKQPHDEPAINSEIKMLLKGSIRFYQLFLSTQDMPVCNFVPGCSQFSTECIQRFGVFRGILLASDRLQRCNSMSNSRYQTDYNSGRLLDPVQTYEDMHR